MSRNPRRRTVRNARSVGAIAQSPWQQIHYQRPPTGLLSDDEIESIHQTALRILSEIGMTVLSPMARKFLQSRV